jgi:hypothetical protein
MELPGCRVARHYDAPTKKPTQGGLGVETGMYCMTSSLGNLRTSVLMLERHYLDLTATLAAGQLAQLIGILKSVYNRLDRFHR